MRAGLKKGVLSKQEQRLLPRCYGNAWSSDEFQHFADLDSMNYLQKLDKSPTSVSVNFISLVTSRVGLQEEEPQTARPRVLNMGVSCSR